MTLPAGGLAGGLAGGPAPVVELRRISKRYAEGTGLSFGARHPEPVHWANREVSLNLRAGEILCLAGENGAGKTTLMNILYGLVPPTEGEILVKGRKVDIHSPVQANRLGIGMVHQHFMLFPEFTVAQNVVMGAEPVRLGVFYDTAAAERRVRALIAGHHFSVRPETPAGELTVGEMQQVEILKMLYRNADILILDEPTAVLTDREIDALFRTLKLLAQSGKSLILITHRLNEITRIASRVAIMRRGELIGVRDTGAGAGAGAGNGKIDEFEISRLMVGAEVALWTDTRRRENRAAGEPVITFENVGVERRGQKQPLLSQVSFTAHAGEILAFAGVGGNGLGALEAVLGGFLPITSGRVLLHGEDVSRLTTRELRKRGLAYVPADRMGVAAAGEARVWENLIVNRRGEFFRPNPSRGPRGWLRGLLPGRKDARDYARGLIKRFGIQGDADQRLDALSGGNIQKVILAREIDQYRDYLVFSEPAWGLDVAASRYVYEQIAALREKGAALILISSNLDEILSLADRIIVFYRGTAAAELRPEGEGKNGDIKRALGAYMTGLKHET
ncbi:MAG: ABC transporter ATP-binding protein [Treponema sp.]|jgi:simple sugar transport system ATP-binding protein|nr:ABC transporter ATP-binding protein [Treponema sp.]